MNINAADSAVSGSVSAKKIVIGNKDAQDNTPTEQPNAIVNLGKSATLGTPLAAGDIGTLSVIDLKNDAKIISLSGDGVTNTINAAKLNINGGQNCYSRCSLMAQKKRSYYIESC